MTKLILSFIMVFTVLFQTTPQPVVNGVLFYSPDCSYCQAVIGTLLPPLRARYGAGLNIVEVALGSVEDVNALYDSADFFGLKREDVAVPFLVVGSQALVGQDAIQAKLPGLIDQGLTQGGIPAPRLPAALQALAERSTAAPMGAALKGDNATPLPPGVDQVPAAPGSGVAAFPPGTRGNCAQGQPGSCPPIENAAAAAPTPASPALSPLLWGGAALAGVLILGGGVYTILSRRKAVQEDEEE